MSTVEHRLEKETGEGSTVRLLCLSRGEVTLPQALLAQGRYHQVKRPLRAVYPAA